MIVVSLHTRESPLNLVIVNDSEAICLQKNLRAEELLICALTYKKESTEPIGDYNYSLV